jgi:hypothetical protein
MTQVFGTEEAALPLRALAGLTAIENTKEDAWRKFLLPGMVRPEPQRRELLDCKEKRRRTGPFYFSTVLPSISTTTVVAMGSHMGRGMSIVVLPSCCFTVTGLPSSSW